MRSPATPPTADSPGEKPSPAAGLRLDRFDNSSFDRGAGPLKEGLWILCKCAFFLNPFPWPSAVRTALLRLFGARIGRGVVVRSGANITFPWRFTAGDHVWIGEDVLVLSLAPVTLGSHVCLSQRAFLCTGSHAWRSETFDLRTRPIIVGDSVWIAAQAFVGAGVSIGSGSVVSAACVVMENVPDNSLAKGNPATVISKFAV